MKTIILYLVVEDEVADDVNNQLESFLNTTTGFVRKLKTCPSTVNEVTLYREAEAEGKITNIKRGTK